MRVVKGTRDYGTPPDNAEKGWPVAPCSLTRTRAVRVHGVHVIFNTHRQIRTDESCVFTPLVSLTLPFSLPSFLLSLHAVERLRRSRRVRLPFVVEAFNSIEQNCFPAEKRCSSVIHRNWIINENQYVFIVVFIIGLYYFLKCELPLLRTISVINGEIY